MKRILLFFLTALIILSFSYLGCSISESINTSDNENTENISSDSNQQKVPFVASNKRVSDCYEFSTFAEYIRFDPDKHYLYNYNSSGLSTIKYYVSDSLISKRTYTNSNYRTMLCEYESAYSSTDYSYVYNWDSSGNYITKIKKFTASNSLVGYWTFTYNSSGKLYKKRYYNSSGTNTFVYKFSYNSSGNLITITYTNLVLSGLYKVLTFGYDSSENLTKITTYNYQNNTLVLNDYSTFTYDYDNDVFYRWYYDSSGNFQKIRMYYVETGTPRYTPHDPLLAYNFFISVY